MWWHSHADRDGDSYSYRDGYSHRDSDSDVHGDSNGNCYAHSYHGTASNSVPEAAPDTGASSLGWREVQEIE